MATVERRAIPVAREERYRQVMAGRAAGLTLKQIANTLGISVQTVSAAINDPDGSKQRARKDRYRGVCKRCGGSTSGCNGPGTASSICMHCRGPEISAAMRGRGPVVEAILAAVTPGPTSRRVILESVIAATGTNENVVSVVLNRLLRYGMVRRVSRAMYVRDTARGSRVAC